MKPAHASTAAGIMLASRTAWSVCCRACWTTLARRISAACRAIGRDKPLASGEFVWQQGDGQTGIVSDPVRPYPQLLRRAVGREVTLAYWFSGNFVGGPRLFGTGPHMWSSVAVERSELTFIPGPALRKLALESATIAVALLDALAFKARCYSAMAQMLGTRSGDGAAASAADFPVADTRHPAGPRNHHCGAVHPWRPRRFDRLDPAMGHRPARAHAAARNHPLSPRADHGPQYAAAGSRGGLNLRQARWSLASARRQGERRTYRPDFEPLRQRDQRPVGPSRRQQRDPHRDAVRQVRRSGSRPRTGRADWRNRNSGRGDC